MRKYEFHVILERADVQTIKDTYGQGALAKLVRTFVMSLANRVRSGTGIIPATDAEAFVDLIYKKEGQDEPARSKDATGGATGA